MEPREIFLVVCLTAVIVIGANAAVYAMVRGHNNISQIELMRRAAKRARRPWGDEDDALQELSRRVEGLKPPPAGPAAPPADKGNRDA